MFEQNCRAHTAVLSLEGRRFSLPVLVGALSALASAVGCDARLASENRAPTEGVATQRQALVSSDAGVGSVTAFPLQLEVMTNSCGANQMQNFFEVINNGKTPVKLSDITIKFWADDTTGQM